jgi:hypothetical protein
MMPVKTESCTRCDEVAAALPINVSRLPQALKTVLIYEDFQISLLGKAVFDFIVTKAGAEGSARLTVWRFDLFHTATMTVAVSLQAEEADVIIVATRDQRCLPPQVRQWLERWSQRRKLATGALVAVFDPGLGQHAVSSPSAVLLQSAAARAGMEFFCTAGGTQGQAPQLEATADAQV